MGFDDAVPGNSVPVRQEAEDDDDEDLFGDDDEDKESPAPDPARTAENDKNISVGVDTTPKDPEKPAVPKLEDTASTPHSVPAKTPAGSTTTPTIPPPSSPDIPIPKRSSLPTPPPLPPSSSLPDPATFGLPVGVRIPKSAAHVLREAKGKLIDTIKSLPLNLINDALVEYDDAVEIKGQSIRNHGAYLFGVIKRYQSVVSRAQSTGNSEILPMGNQITPAVHNRLEQLVNTGYCTRDEMNDKLRSKIRMLSERDALLALDELSSVERHSIRNFASYVMGLLQRYQRGEQPSKMRPETRGRDAQPRSYRDNSSASNHRSMFARDRSRDRMDDFARNRNHQAPYSSSYDHRRQQQHWNPNKNGQPPPPPPQNNSYPNNTGGYRDDRNRSLPGVMQSQQQGMYPPSGQMQRPQQGLNNPNGPPMQFNNPNSRPGMNMRGMPPQYNGGMQQAPSMMQQQQQQFMPQQQHVPPPPPQQPMNQQAYGGNMMHQQQQVPPQQQQFQMGAAPWQQQQQQQQPQQHAPGLPVDIMGLADKAASAVQALANQGHARPQAGSMAYNNNGSSTMGQQQYNNSFSMPVSSNPQQRSMGMSQPPQQPYGQHQQMNGMDAGTKRSGRRTTASLHQLPQSVQYLVQTIQGSGAVNGPLDDGILGMIHDLPENMALTALQRFISIDKSTMRNKTAYLAGILRRELETIHKR